MNLPAVTYLTEYGEKYSYISASINPILDYFITCTIVAVITILVVLSLLGVVLSNTHKHIACVFNVSFTRCC